MALRVDVGVDAERHAHARFARDRQRIDALELPFRLHIDRLHPEIDRLHELRVRLAHTGKDNLGRDESGTQRDIDLATRIRVGAGPQPPQQPRDRQCRVRLQGVVQRVGVRPERLVDRPVPGSDDVCAVDVERRAFARRYPGKRHAIAGERAIWSMKA